MRGLKQPLKVYAHPRPRVALLVSAWIETSVRRSPASQMAVALLVSAWIETPLIAKTMAYTLSRTPRECVD